MADFDILCEDYEKILDNDLKICGENHRYFIEFKALWVKEFLANLHIDSNINILDVGCGLGGLNEYISLHIPNATYYGIDISFKSIQKAYCHCQNKVLKQSYYCSYDGMKIPFKKNSFHIVILAGVLHHILPSVRFNIFSEIYKVLRTDGFLFVFEHNSYNPVVQYIVKKCVIDRNAKLLTLGAVKNFFLKANFEIIKGEYIIFFPRFLKKWRFLEKRLSRLPLGAQYVIVGKKL